MSIIPYESEKTKENYGFLLHKEKIKNEQNINMFKETVLLINAEAVREIGHRGNEEGL